MHTKLVSPLKSLCFFSRTGDASHVAACYELLKTVRFIYDDISWNALPGMFSKLLISGAMQLSLVEGRGLDGPMILAFCGSIFVTDAFCREARNSLQPYLGLEVARRYLDHTLPLLEGDSLASLNAKNGVSVITCYSARLADSTPDTHLLSVREKLAEAFRLTHCGYRLNEVLCATIGDETLRWALDAGFKLRRDYSDLYDTPPNPALRPWLVGLTKDEAIENYGSRASGLFVFTPPRFSFSRGEQLVLRLSLAGHTDDAIASGLSLSRWTVKKRWQSIYNRVEGVDKYLLPKVNRSPEHQRRGAERRRHLLAYLRQHVEELRPLTL